MKKPSSHLRAIGLALTGFALWVGGDMFMKLAGETGAPKYEIMMIGGFGGMAVIFCITALRRQIGALRPKKHRALAALALMFFLNYMIWLKVLAHLPLANFYTVIFLAPTVAAIFAAVFMKEPLSLAKILAIIAGFIGVVIAVNPVALLHDREDWVSYGMAFLGMLSIVTQMLMMRFIGNHESRESTAFYPRIGAVIGGLILALIGGFEPIGAKTVVYSLATGAVGGMGWMCMAQAYKLAPAATVAPFHYSQIITGALLGYLIWHDIPSAHLLTGAAIIISSGLYIVTHARKTDQLANTLVENP